jgi:threonine aldolase
MTPVEPTELVAGAWQLRPWPVAHADLDEVLAERYPADAVAAAREARLTGWERGDLLGFAVRAATTGASVAEVLVAVTPEGRAAVDAWTRPGAGLDADVTDVVGRWATGALGLAVDEPAPVPGSSGAGTRTDDEALAERRRAARRGCTRWLTGHGDVSPAAWLAETAAAATEADLDRYGEAGEVAALEREVADLLGMAAAVFLPSGILAQQAALRAWAERSPTDAVAVHGLSHLVLHELDALTELHGLRPQLLTREPRQPTVADLDALAGPLAAVTLELPLRDAGFLLPTWDELVAFGERVRERGVPLHLDGARLWESGPYYGRPYAEIAGLADSVYVSFYKGLGGMAGAALAGPADLIAAARRWQVRHGGRLFTLLPYAVAAREGLRRYLPRMGEYAERARDLAAALDELPGVRVLPRPPHTNSFRLFVDVDHDRLVEAGLRTAEQQHVALLLGWVGADVPGWSMTELVVGDATLAWPVDQQAAAVADLVDLARSL